MVTAGEVAAPGGGGMVCDRIGGAGTGGADSADSSVNMEAQDVASMAGPSASDESETDSSGSSSDEAGAVREVGDAGFATGDAFAADLDAAGVGFAAVGAGVGAAAGSSSIGRRSIIGGASAGAAAFVDGAGTGETALHRPQRTFFPEAPSGARNVPWQFWHKNTILT